LAVFECLSHTGEPPQRAAWIIAIRRVELQNATLWLAYVIDLHCHVLPGIDDGPQTIEASLALARAAQSAGTRTLVATPHVNWRYRNDAETIARLVGELSDRVRAEGLSIEIRPGAEIAMTRIAELDDAELSRLRLGGGPWILVEPPFTAAATGLGPTLLELQSRGQRVVLAHPERCPAFQREPDLLRSLVCEGILTSITAGSLVGGFGAEVRRFTVELVREGIVHNVASDAHDHLTRAPSILVELEQAGLGPLGDWLTHAVPGAILEGREIPPRPEVAPPHPQPRRRWWPPRR
jgi:protein-tyrosine phosphatase